MLEGRGGKGRGREQRGGGEEGSRGERERRGREEGRGEEGRERGGVGKGRGRGGEGEVRGRGEGGGDSMHGCVHPHTYVLHTHADTPTCTTTYTCMRTHMLTHPPTCSHLQRCWALGSSLPSLQTPHEQLERYQVSSVGPPPASTLERRRRQGRCAGMDTHTCTHAHTLVLVLPLPELAIRG